MENRKKYDNDRVTESEDNIRYEKKQLRQNIICYTNTTNRAHTDSNILRIMSIIVQKKIKQFNPLVKKVPQLNCTYLWQLHPIVGVVAVAALEDMKQLVP